MDFLETSERISDWQNQISPSDLSETEAKRNIKPCATVSKVQERILVMDDEEAIRITLTRLLKRLNYDVVAVSDGAAAVEEYCLAKNSACPFSLVILDITVPGGMGGLDTLQHLLLFDQQVKVVMSSGYSSELSVSNYSQHGFIDVLIKPYGLRELTAVLQKALQSDSK